LRRAAILENASWLGDRQRGPDSPVNCDHPLVSQLLLTENHARSAFEAARSRGKLCPGVGGPR